MDKSIINDNLAIASASNRRAAERLDP